MSFFIAKLTAPVEPGSVKISLLFTVPAIARDKSALVPTSSA